MSTKNTQLRYRNQRNQKKSNTKTIMIASWIIFAIVCIAIVAIVVVPKGNKKKDTKKADKVTEEAKKPEEKEEEKGLVKCENQEIITLVTNYFEAMTKCDNKTLQTLVVDVNEFKDYTTLKAIAQVVEGYENIDVYTIKGEKEGTYVAYVVVDTKLQNIETTSPGLHKFYIITDENGAFKVQNSTNLEESEKNFLNQCDVNEEVANLVDTVNKKYQDALSKDKDLKAFDEKANSQTNQTENTSNNKDNQETKENSQKKENSKTTETKKQDS